MCVQVWVIALPASGFITCFAARWGVGLMALMLWLDWVV
jgi:hypothetical protein